MTPDDNLPAKPLTDLGAAARRLRSAIMALAAKWWREPMKFVAEARKLIAAAEPQLAEHIRAGQLLAYLESAKAAVRSAGIPKRAATPHADAHGLIDSKPLPALSTSAYPSPVLVNVALGSNWLHQRIPFEKAEFDQLDADAKRVAFTAAKTAGEATVRKLRDRIAQAVENGQTLPQFRQAAADALEASALTPAQVETVYRTHVGRAQTAGAMKALAHPLVRDQFPYLLYTAIHDSRVRAEHKMMEKLGLDETAVYRIDDPVWDEFLPPWAWNCRCAVVPIDKETAADYGVREAIEWVRSGIPPAVPTWVEHPPFYPPDGWVPTSSALEVLKV